MPLRQNRSLLAVEKVRRSRRRVLGAIVAVAAHVALLASQCTTRTSEPFACADPQSDFSPLRGRTASDFGRQQMSAHHLLG
jgi:hypothetical protein